MAARKTIDLGSAGRASLAPEGKGVREFLQKPVSWPPCPGKAVGAHLLVICVCPCDAIAIATAIAMWCRAAVSSSLLLALTARVRVVDARMFLPCLPQAISRFAAACRRLLTVSCAHRPFQNHARASLS